MRTTFTATTSAAAILVLLHQPQGASAFLSGLISRHGAKPRAPPQARPLFSVDWQQRNGGPPQLDEFGLPVEEVARPDSKPFKDQLYDALDGATNLVDTYLLRSGNSEAEQRRMQESTRRAIERRRARNRIIKVKDTVLLALDYTLHPNKAWHDLVAAPLTEARERHRAKKAARRRSLEQALQAYQRTKSRFYETLDLVQESTRTTVRVAKTVGSAVQRAPQTVQETVESVQQTTDRVAKVGAKVSRVVSGLLGKAPAAAETPAAAAPLATQEKGAVAAPPPPPPPPPPAAVPTMASSAVAEKKAEPTADKATVAAIWEKPPSSASVVSPPKPALSFRQRLDLEEARGGRFGRERWQASGGDGGGGPSS